MRVLSAACLCLAMTMQLAWAADDWSFGEHPHPLYPDEYTQEEQALIADTQALELGLTSCPAREVYDYLVYNRRYPEYALTHRADEGLESWKLHVLRSQRSASAFCIVETVSEQLRTLYSYHFEPPTDGLFCGRFGRPAESLAEVRIVELLKRFISYAETGHYFATSGLLRLAEWADIRLNPDIRYFLEAGLERRYGNEPAPILRRTVIELQGEERLAFVEAALERNDLKAVIETSPDCSAFTPEARAAAREAARGDPI